MLLFHIGPSDARDVTLGELRAGARIVERANRR
jgi:hypothetical protein